MKKKLEHSAKQQLLFSIQLWSHMRVMIDFSFLCALSVLVRFKTFFSVNVNVQFYDGVQKLFKICTQHSKIKKE